MVQNNKGKGETKFQKVERLYGKDNGAKTVEPIIKWLKEHDYPNLANLITPTKQNNIKEEVKRNDTQRIYKP